MSSDEDDENVKSHLPVPMFTNDTALTFKGKTKKTYKQAKSLLCAAKSLPKTDLTKDKFSLNEKLTEIYCENSEKNAVRDGSFIKCDYLEELVMQENLNYFIMKIYPSKIFLYIRNQDLIKYFYCTDKEPSDLLDSIDKEEIPTVILDIIISCEYWDLMYDYHCFLQIQKYLEFTNSEIIQKCEDNSAQPVFSSFVLLKPTNQILMCLNYKYYFDNINNNEIPQELSKENHETELFFEVSGPLYLDVSPAALELILLLQIYQSPFGSASIKSALAKRPMSTDKKFMGENHFEEKELLERLWKKTPHPSNSSREEYFQLNNSCFPYTDLKEDLRSSLVKRNLEISDAMYNSRVSILVEVFELTFNLKEEGFEKKTSKKKAFTANNSLKCKEEDKRYLSVFWKNRQFYSCLTLDKYTYNHRNPDGIIKLVGEREQLDKYILKVAEIVSCRFNKPLHIQYKNVLQKKDVLFFPIIPRPNGKIEFERELSKKDFHKENFTEYRGSETKTEDFSQKEGNSSDEGDNNQGKEDIVEKANELSEKDYEIMCDCQIEQMNEKMLKTLTGSTETNDTTDDAKKVTVNSSECGLAEMSSQKALTNGIETSDDLDVMEKETIDSEKDDNKSNIENDSLSGYIKHADDILMDNYLSRIINSDSFRSIFSNSKGASNTQSTSASFISEAFSVETDSEKSIFEAHTFEEGKRVAVGSTSETSDKRIVIYPSLKSEFTFTEEDFMKDAFHEHTEDMKKLLKLICGCED